MTTSDKTSFQQIPSVETLVESPELMAWNDKLVRAYRVRMAQRVIDALRTEIKKGAACPARHEIVNRLQESYQAWTELSLKKVINATGVVLHTNLGRAPLGIQWWKNAAGVLDGYCDLEFDLARGDRGSRTGRVEALIELCTGAESALVVNNNAAALVLALHAIAKGKSAVVSRGELVQIGGGFRIPEIMETSGVHLKEVGTTNITSIEDYEKAITSDTAVLLKVHQSNFVVEGHTQSVSLKALAMLSKTHEIPLVFDLGGGAMLRLAVNETRIQEALDQGADIVCFSGDKLLGGAQAGFIIGKASWIKKLKECPLYRALRVGKTEIYFLEAALHDYLEGRQPPAVKLITLDPNEIKDRALAIATKLGSQASVVAGTSSVGGGALPAEELPTWLIEIPVDDVEAACRTLLTAKVPVVARKAHCKLSFDLRTVFPSEEAAFIETLRERLLCSS